MAYTKKTTHLVEALANLISQFQDKPNIAKLVTSYIRQIQDLEDMFSDILTETTLANAKDQQLDDIGALVGEPRAGRDDTQYRTAIRARISLNNSGGTIEDIINLAQGVIGSPISVKLTEVYPAGFILNLDDPVDPSDVDILRLASFIANGRGGGIRGILTFFVPDAFQYDGAGAVGYDQGPYGGAFVA